MALEFLEAQANAQPELAEWYGKMADLYQRKLWHQLTVKLEQFIALPVVQTGDVLIQLYHNFIKDFQTEINRLKFAYIAVMVSLQYSDKDDAINYLDSIIGNLENKPLWMVGEPIVYMSVQKAAYYIQKGDVMRCKMILEDEMYRLNSMTDIDPSVQSNYYWALSEFHKSQHDFVEFYKSALLGLSYASLESLPARFKENLAFNLSLSALLGDSICNFGELLTHPIINSLIGTEGEWLYHILQAFNYGDLIDYQRLRQIHNSAFSAQSVLVANEGKLLEKFNIMHLMEIIFWWPSHFRNIPLSIIAERTKLSIEDVDFLLMKALSLHLINGIIDQVEGTVYISWVQPRVLGIPPIELMRDWLDLWIAQLRKVYSTVEAKTRDLID